MKRGAPLNLGGAFTLVSLSLFMMLYVMTTQCRSVQIFGKLVQYPIQKIIPIYFGQQG